MKKSFTVNCMRTNEDFDGYTYLLQNNIYQNVELFYPYNVDETQRSLYTKRALELVDKFKLTPILHLPHGHNNDLVNDKEHVVLNRMFEAIDYANSLNVDRVTLHLGSYKNMTREEAINEVCDVVYKITAHASKLNINVMIENMPGYNELGYSPEEILYIIKRVNLKNLKFILDTGHANVSKYNILDYVYILKDYLYHMHFSDNDSTRDAHKRVNSGNIDFVSLFKSLNEINYQYYHCMEVIFKEYTDLIEYAKDIDIYDKYYK